MRIVTHGLSAADDDMAGSLVAGWTQALATLRVHLASFAGRPSASARVWSSSEDPLDTA